LFVFLIGNKLKLLNFILLNARFINVNQIWIFCLSRYNMWKNLSM